MSTSTSTSTSTTPQTPASTSISSKEQTQIAAVLKKLQWMRANKIWPNGLRYLWTDAHGIILLVSLYRATGDRSYLDQAEQVVRDVKLVLGRSPGFRIGEEPDRDGQYFHYLTKWIFAMISLHTALPNSTYRQDTIKMVREIHPRFIRRGVGVVWKMKEDLSGPYHGYGLGGLDHYDGYVMYRLLDNGEGVLRREISDMYDLVQATYEEFECRQDLGLGEILWLGHFFPDEEWSKHTRKIALDTLDKMWVDVDGKRGYFRRDRYGSARTIIAFANHGVCYGLQSVKAWPERVENTLRFFEDFRSGDPYDYNAITHVMHCNALYPGIMLLAAEELAREQHVPTASASASASAPASMKKEKEEEKQQEKIKEEAIRIAQEHKA